MDTHTIEFEAPMMCDMHLHFRWDEADGNTDMFDMVVPVSAEYCSIMLGMPNPRRNILNQPLAVEYKQGILDRCPSDRPLPSIITPLKVTQDMDTSLITNEVEALKLYPDPDPNEQPPVWMTSLQRALWFAERGTATTNSHGGVYNFKSKGMQGVYETCQDKDIPLLVHPEDPTAESELDAEAKFI